jgi:ATP/maltotriose-dependent transcriptional regulator MalT
MELGDADAAALFRECMDALEQIGDVGCSAICQRSLGSLALDAGQPDDALRWLCESLDGLAHRDNRSLAVALADIATVRAGRGEVDVATNLVAAAHALARRPGLPLSECEQSRLTRAAELVGASAPVALDTIDLDAVLEIARS